MVASGVWAGVIPLEKAHNLREVGGNGRTMKQELDRIGYLGEKDAHHQAIPLGVRCYDQLLLAIIDKLRPTSNYISVNIPPRVALPSWEATTNGESTCLMSVVRERAGVSH